MSNETKKSLLEAGAKLASKHGTKNVTRRMVSKAAKVSESLVSHYMGNTADAQKKYAAHAKKMGLALPNKDAEAKMGATLRKKATKKPAPAKAKKVAAKKAPAKKAAAKKAVAKKQEAKATAKRKPAKKAAAKKPARKRSIAEVRAIKDKVAGTRTAARKPKTAPVELAPPSLPPPPLPPANAQDSGLPPLPEAPKAII